eukprot:EG_transcript_7277
MTDLVRSDADVAPLVDKTATKGRSASASTSDDPGSAARVSRADGGRSPPSDPVKRVSLLPLIALIYYEVSGGPFGLEDAVGAAGSMVTILALLVFPVLWGLPQALVAAELISMFPEDSGFVAWVTCAFGRFLGFQEGFLLWCSCVADSALYPVLFLEYFSHLFPVFEQAAYRTTATYVIITLLAWLNYRGLNAVGIASVWLALFCLTPFLAIIVLGLPHIKPSVWVFDWQIPSAEQWQHIDWRTFLNVLFWSLNSWDSASTLAGEVENPTRTFPRALHWTLLAVTAVYVLPLLVATGICVPTPKGECQSHEEWRDGYFATVALQLGGRPLQALLVLAAALSNVGLFSADLSASSFLILGMTESGFLPSILAQRSRYGTPVYGIALSTVPVFLIALHPFTTIMEALNCLYCIAVPFQFAAFMWLRWTRPNAPRPFKVPFPMWLMSLLVLSANLIMLSVLMQASFTVLLLSNVVILSGAALYAALSYAARHKSCIFQPHNEALWLAPLATVHVAGPTKKDHG